MRTFDDLSPLLIFVNKFKVLCSCGKVAQNGHKWLKMAQSGPKMLNLPKSPPKPQKFEQNIQNCQFVLYWAILGDFGWFWVASGYFGPFGLILGYFRPFFHYCTGAQLNKQKLKLNLNNQMSA